LDYGAWKAKIRSLASPGTIVALLGTDADQK
jgi:hypothetical protein